MYISAFLKKKTLIKHRGYINLPLKSCMYSEENMFAKLIYGT